MPSLAKICYINNSTYYLFKNLTTSGRLLNLDIFYLSEPSPLVIGIFILFKSKVIYHTF